MGITEKLVSAAVRRTAWSEGHVFAFAPEQIGIVEGCRTALAIGLLLVAQMALGIPELAYGAVAAFWTSLCDPRGPDGSRVRTMTTFAMLGCAMMTGSAYAAYWGPYASGIAIFSTVFMCGLTRTYQPAFGPTSSQIGLIASVAGVVGVSAPAAFDQAVVLGACFLVGALFYVLVALVVWRDRPNTSWNLAMIAVLTRLEQALLTLQQTSITSTSADWRELESVHYRAIRFAAERARQLASSTEDVGSPRCVAIDMAGRLFSAVVALVHYRQTGPGTADHEFERQVLARLRLLLVAANLANGSHTRPGGEVVDEARSLSRALADRTDVFSRAVVLAADSLASLVSSWQRPIPNDTRISGNAAFGVTLSPGAWKLSLKTAIAVVVSYFVGITFDLSLAYWGAITTLVVMQPLMSNTWLRVLERATGTMIGGFLAALFISWAGTRWEMALIIVPLSAVVIALRLVNYGMFVIFLTPFFMLLTDYANPVDDLMWERVVNEARGACVAIIAGLLLWPQRERDNVTASLSAAVVSHLAYVEAVLGATGRTREQDSMQRSAGIASSRLESAQQRFRLEGMRQSERMIALSNLTAALRDVCGAATVLSLTRRDDELSNDIEFSVYVRLLATELELQLTKKERLAMRDLPLTEHLDLIESLAKLRSSVIDYATAD